MKYRLFIQPQAVKSLKHLPPDTYFKIKQAILELAVNPRPRGSQKLTARAGFRIQIGSYRLIYEIEDKMSRITVLHIGHRKDIYR